MNFQPSVHVLSYIILNKMNGLRFLKTLIFSQYDNFSLGIAFLHPRQPRKQTYIFSSQGYLDLVIPLM